jgi:hypothetical protein
MCEPISLGVATAASGAMGAIGSHQSASAQANAANAAATSNYKYQLKVREREWDRTRHKYGRAVHQYGSQVNQNQLAAAKAYAGEQRRLNDVYDKASFQTQNLVAKLIQSTGSMAASGRTGKSAERVGNQNNQAYGRNMAIQQQSLQSAGYRYNNTVDSLRRQLMSDNNKAYEKVAINPQPGVAPPPPIMQQGPSGLSLASGLLSSATSGYSTYQELEQYQPKDGLD